MEVKGEGRGGRDGVALGGGTKASRSPQIVSLAILRVHKVSSVSAPTGVQAMAFS